MPTRWRVIQPYAGVGGRAVHDCAASASQMGRSSDVPDGLTNINGSEITAQYSPLSARTTLGDGQPTRVGVIRFDVSRLRLANQNCVVKPDAAISLSMGRDRIDEQTPDLFQGVGGASTNQAGDVKRSRPPRRPALPKDLHTAIKYLDNGELDRLLRAATEEARQRGRLAPGPDTTPTKVNPVSGLP